MNAITYLSMRYLPIRVLVQALSAQTDRVLLSIRDTVLLNISEAATAGCLRDVRTRRQLQSVKKQAVEYKMGRQVD